MIERQRRNGIRLLRISLLPGKVRPSGTLMLVGNHPVYIIYRPQCSGYVMSRHFGCVHVIFLQTGLGGVRRCPFKRKKNLRNALAGYHRDIRL